MRFRARQLVFLEPRLCRVPVELLSRLLHQGFLDELVEVETAVAVGMEGVKNFKTFIGQFGSPFLDEVFGVAGLVDESVAK